jgi:hypothetical protein
MSIDDRVGNPSARQITGVGVRAQRQKAHCWSSFELGQRLPARSRRE